MRLVFFSLVILVTVPFVAISQNYTRVNVNQSVNVFIINGVSSTEDIGGVECNALSPQNSQNIHKVKFTNYNKFNVSVLYKIEVIDATKNKSYKNGSIVLSKGETKTIEIKYPTLGDIKIITQRIGDMLDPIQNNSEELTMVAGYLIKYPQSITIDGRARAQEFIDGLNSKRVYGKSNWRLPSDNELSLLHVDNSNNMYYSTDNWNRFNIHPTKLLIVCDK